MDAGDTGVREAALTRTRTEASGCQACDLYANATQTVFGEGHVGAAVMLVGEQPGDVEDETGRPFVGPAGRVLAEALEAAGIEREQSYVTNAVKHFKWEPRGKRRIHKRPNDREVRACKRWLDQEIALVRPAALVLLGATAAQAVLGKEFRITRQRGTAVDSELAELVTATIHPSAVLRAGGGEERRLALESLVDDLGLVRRFLDSR